MMNKKRSTGLLDDDAEIRDLLCFYTESLKLDKHDLDTGCIEQPEIFQRVSSDLARFVSLRDRAKRSLADAEALVDVEVRKAFSSRKVTEKEIAATVRLDQRIIDATDSLMYYSYVVGRLGALKEAYEHRRAMIKELVTLYQIGYWGEVSGRREARDASERQASYVKAEVSKRREPLQERRKRARLDKPLEDPGERS